MTPGMVEDRDKPISIVLIEDNRLVREGLVALIRKQPDFTMLAAPASVATALKKVREARPRVVLLDCGLVGHDSAQLTATLHNEVPETRIIGMGLLPLREDVTELVSAGASGFIMKNAPIGDFLATIRLVVRGVEVVPPQLMLSLVPHIALEAAGDRRREMLEALRLTKAESQVIASACDSRSSEEIASQLGMSLLAVKSHMQNLLEKLALRTRLEEGAAVPPVRRRREVVPPS
jgi:DNA-binding NarL/FixJ family response regulator